MNTQSPQDLSVDIQQALAQKTAECQYLSRQLQESAETCQRLNQQLRWYEDSEQLLVTIAGLNYQSHHLTQTFHDIVRQVQTLMQVDRVCLYRLQFDHSCFVMAEAVRSQWPAILGFLIRDVFVSSPTWIQRYEQGQVCLIPDLADWNLAEVGTQSDQTAAENLNTETLLNYFHVKAKLVLPIQVHQQLWGLLVIHECASSRQWQPAETYFLQRLTWQLGVAIRQEQLHQEFQGMQEGFSLQRQTQANHLKQALAFEAMLTRITDRVRDSLDEQQILQTAIQELTVVLRVHYCQAILCDPNQTACSIQYEYRAPLMALDQPEWRTQEAFVDTIPYAKQLCEQIHQGDLFQFCLTEPFLNQGQEAILIAPILDDQGCLGSLRLFTQRTHGFDMAELRLVQQVVNHCAIAIRQARLFEASQTQVKAMERLNRLKDDFLSTISHELRTPLSTIKMVTNLLKVSLQPELQPLGAAQVPMADISQTKLDQYLKVLEDECDREIHLIDDLLSTQRLSAGDYPVSLMPICLQEWIPHIAETFVQRLEAHQQSLTLAIPDDLPLLVSDTFMLNRILTELLNNACKYTPAGETITIAADLTSTAIEIAVKNTGIEIASDEMRHVFEPFYRIPNSDPWKQSGTGLGLSLIKKLVEHLGGTVRVESSINQVCFKVHFPRIERG